jgi:serine/threonine protein kinase
MSDPIYSSGANSSDETTAATGPREEADPVAVFPWLRSEQATSAQQGAPQTMPRSPSVPGYEVFRVLGRGGMGVVYQARDLKLNRIVALKTILAGAHAGEADLRRFRTEAEAVARVQHPNIVQIFEVGTHEGLPFFSMEFCAGGTLADRLDGTPRPPDISAQLAETVAHALSAAHAAGVLHRDLKPGNVFLTSPASTTNPPSTAPSGTPPAPAPAGSATDPDRTWPKASSSNLGTLKIGDFGLAKLIDTEDSRTHTGAVMGTPSYMAPEQAFGHTKQIGTSVDIYSLGAILYELLTGRPPFKGATAADTLDRVRREEPVPPRLFAKVPRDLETICLKALQKDPDRRYPTAAAMADDLERFRSGRTILARPVGPIGRLTRWAVRNPRVAALAGSAAAMLFAIAVGSIIFAVSMNDKNNEINGQNEEIKKRNVEIERSLRAETAAREDAQAERAQAQAQSDRNMKLVRFILSDVAGQLREPRFAQVREVVLNRTFAELERQLKSDAEGGQMADRGRISFANQMGELYLARAFNEQGAARQQAFNKARDHFMRAHEIAKRQADEDPTSPLAKGNLALSHAALGKIYLRANAIDKAKVEFQESFRLRQEVYENPGPLGDKKSLAPADVRTSLASAYSDLAQVAKLQKNKDLAGEYSAKMVKLREEALQLVEFDPKNTIHNDGAVQFRRDLAATRINQAKELLGDKGASEKVGELLAEAEKLLEGAADSFEAGARRELAWALALAGDNILFYNSDPRDALKLYERSMAILQSVQKIEDSREIQSDIAMGHYRIGTALVRLKDFGNASQHYRTCLAIREQHFKSSPTERAKMTLMVTLARAGEVDRAVALVEEVRAETKLPQEFPFNAACTYALCAWAVGGWKDDAELKPDDLQKRKDLIAKSLVDLRQLFAMNSPWANKVETDPDFEFLHNREEFKKLLADVKK